MAGSRADTSRHIAAGRAPCRCHPPAGCANSPLSAAVGAHDAADGRAAGRSARPHDPAMLRQMTGIATVRRECPCGVPPPAWAALRYSTPRSPWALRRVRGAGKGGGDATGEGRMNGSGWQRAGRVALALGALCASAVAADVEVQDPQGRRVLLKDDGTWRYIDPPEAAASEPAKPLVQAELILHQQADEPAGCRFVLGLVNTLDYEIRTLTPEFTVYRPNGVAYSAKTVDFGPLRPGDSNLRRVLFGGIGCADIAALRVGAGDRCVMGDLTKFSDVKGECLARVKLRPSELLPFEKEK
jgi:hypothetical protein